MNPRVIFQVKVEHTGGGVFFFFFFATRAFERPPLVQKLIVEDSHNFGPDYDLTLMQWNARFQKHLKSGKINDRDDVFVRMWEYYLMYCAAGFRARTIQLNQVVYSKHRLGRYDAVR